MSNEQKQNIYGKRKQITFDLSQAALRCFYPRPARTINPFYYKRAYSDIRKFMEKNGFKHRQFSVYTSIEKLTEARVVNLIDEIAYQMPWLTDCVKEIDVTNIGTQYSLLKLLERSTALRLSESVVAVEEPKPSVNEEATFEQQAKYYEAEEYYEDDDLEL